MPQKVESCWICASSLEYVHHLCAGLVEIFRSPYIRLADYGIIFASRGIAMAAASILFHKHSCINSAVLLAVAGNYEYPRQALGEIVRMQEKSNLTMLIIT